jgi:excisionase family DNA binding protein
MSQSDRANASIPTARRARERLMSAEEVAEYLGVPVNTLYQWRHKGAGPAAYRVGRHLRYDPSAVQTWLSEHLATGHGAH